MIQDMEKLLKLYTYVDGTNDTPFPNADEQVVIGSFTYTANRMAGAPSISATIKHRLCLDNLWSEKVYAEFNGEKYFVRNTPSSSKGNDDTRYEHDLELLSERDVLNHIYFIDAVQGDSSVDQYKSNSTEVLFFGNIEQFVERLNASLSYSGVSYTAIIDSGITSEDKQVQFSDLYILQALQKGFEIFGIPYYFEGKTVHFGYTSNAIPIPLKYGHDSAFLSISKENANYQVINRITGTGSSDNIPYYYPNDTDDRSEIESSGGKWITPSQKLMPPIYRESLGAQRFYNAVNNTYPNGEGGYYGFENEYSASNPMEGIVSFEDIKPSIVGATNALGQRIDMFLDFAYDLNDNDETDEEGNYLHPYFFAKLRKTDGAYGFNLFDQAIESQPMQISFTSGICGACTFEIGVGEETQKNTVQVSDSGALLRDENGNVRYGTEENPEVPQDRQNDTRNYEVWIALKKDISTYPQIMPNAGYNYKPSVNDTFVILGITLPKGYILKAEQELEDALIKYMWENNMEKFTFSAKFSRIFFREHPEVLEALNENARVIIEYNGQEHTFYVDEYTYKMDSVSPLPEIEINLVDTLNVGQNSLQNVLDSVKQDILSSIGGGDFLKQGLKYFLRKDVQDTAKEKITFIRGLDVGTYAENSGGGTMRILEDLSSYIEVDRLRVRIKAYFETLEIINTNSIGGKMILTAGGGVYLREVKDREVLEDGTEQVWDYYRCYFLTEQDGRSVENRFKIGDLAISQSFNIKAGVHQGVTNHYYWREVIGIGEDYIDLSKSICDTGSDAPMIEDTVVHLGNRTDAERQGALIFSAVDVFSPSIMLYHGINDFSLTDKEIIAYGIDKTTNKAFFRNYGDFYTGDKEQTSYVKYTQGVGMEIRGKFVNESGESISDILDRVQMEIDGNIETWFYEPEPTLGNEPAVNWGTESEKINHLGDLYYSGEGKAYRFQKEGDNYIWKLLQDSDITKALADAKKAQEDAAAAQQDAKDAKDRLDQWASDGIISPTEKSGIKDEIARIDSDYEEINANYEKYKIGIPTSYNTAYQNYRNQLVALSAPTPENIEIPDNFRTNQTSYYNLRSQALNAISDASRKEVSDLSLLIGNVQEQVNQVKESLTQLNTTVSGLRDFTDIAFADGIVSRSEFSTIRGYLQSIDTFAEDVTESYDKVYNNSLLEGTAKTELNLTYTAFNTAKTELTNAINDVIKDGNVDNLEKANVDGKYAAFNTKYGDFVAALNTANKAIQNIINQNALEALKQIGEYSYLKAALKELTTIEGGLIQSSTLALGYTSDSGYQVMAGTNGIYDSTKLGGGIASWWGGAMYDRFEYTEENMPENVASALVRMDGTGYFAKGNLWWEADGTLHADPLSFFVGPESVGDLLSLFQFIKSDAGIEYVIPQYPFQKLEIGNYIQIGKAQLYWDEDNNAFYVRHEDGTTPVGFYATGYISAMGSNPDSGGTIAGASNLSELGDVNLTALSVNQVLAWNGSKWTNMEMKGSSDLTFNTTGSGNVITAISRGGDVVTAAKGITAALNNGSNASGTWGISINGNADTATKLNSRGPLTALTTTNAGQNGVNLYEAYNNGYPCSYGNLLHVGGSSHGGVGELLMEWSGSESPVTGHLYYRSKRDLASMGWGSWVTILDSSNYTSTLDGRYILKGSAVNSNNNSGWLSFANNAGGIGGTMGVNDNWRIFGRATADNAGYLELATADDGNEPVYVRQYSGVFTTQKRTATLLDGSGNTSFPGIVTANYFKANSTSLCTNLNADLLDGKQAIFFPMRYSFNSDTTNLWHNLGTWNSPRDASSIIIEIFTGDGWNAQASQNVRVKIYIKDSYVNSNTPATAYFGSLMEVYMNERGGNIQYKVIANSANQCTIWVYLPWDYARGWYYVYGEYSNWVHSGEMQSSEPTGNDQTNSGSKAIRYMAYTSSNVASATKLQNARTINGTSFDGTANITTNNWGTARTLSLGNYLSGSVSINGSANVTLNGNVLGLTSQGRKTAISGTTMPANGLRMYEVYNNGYPCSYGNIISAKGAGAGELLLEWSINSAVGHLHYRSKKDNSEYGWSSWGTVAFTTDNVASATKLQTSRTLWGQSFNGTGNVSGNMSGVGSISANGAITTSSSITASGVIYAKNGMWSDGYVSAKGQNSSSDIRLKNILSNVRIKVSDLAKAPLFRFSWKSDNSKIEVGSSAQYWKNVLPDAVKERNGYLEMGYGNIALAGVITIARSVETLEQKVKRLEKENKIMKEQIKKMERRIA